VDLTEFKKNRFQEFYLFNPEKYGKIFVFVDFANVRKWARSFWPEENKVYLTREIDINKLSEIIGHIEPAKKFFYYGHYKEYPDLLLDHPLNTKARDSIYRIDKARKAGFIVRTKDIKEISTFNEDGEFIGKISKCNFDVEITMDMLQKIDKYDSVFLWSGDSDFHLLLQYLKSKGKNIIIACAREFVSQELNRHSGLFIPADPLKEYLELERPKTDPPRF
jgi:uncharacterized LabA/DUF88 family protein